MSGETESDISGWTVDTLHAYLLRRIEDLRAIAAEQNGSLETRLMDMRAALDERYATQTKAVEAALAAQQTAMTTAFTAADKALDKALTAAEKAVEQRAMTLDREFHEHLEQVRHENALAFINSDKAVQAALASAEKAVNKAEAAADKRFESVNEFRGQLSDQAQLFLPRTEYTANHQNLQDRVTDLTDRINRTEGQGIGVQEHRTDVRLNTSALLAWAVAGISFVVAVVSLANALTGK